MKVLLIAERDELYDTINGFFRSNGAEVLRYWSPLKAMDNLDEMSPNVVVFSAEDFPRHWKIFLSFMRYFFTKEEIPFILLKSDNFDYDEAGKATELSVNGILDEKMKDAEDLKRLGSILSRYGKIDEERVSLSYSPNAEDKIDLLFTHPESLILIRGTVTGLTKKELTFLPSQPEKTESLHPPMSIQACSIRIGKSIHTVDLDLIENKGGIVFRFNETPKEILELVG